MPGIDFTSVRTFVPGQANIGYTKPAVVRRVSRTNPRSASLRRSRRGRCVGNVMRASLPNAGVDRTLQWNRPDPRQTIVWLRYPLAFHLRGEHVRSWGQSRRIAPDWKVRQAQRRQRIPIEIETTMGWQRRLRQLARHECFAEFSDRATKARLCGRRLFQSPGLLRRAKHPANGRRRGRFAAREFCGRRLRPVIPGPALRHYGFWERYPHEILLQLLRPPSLPLPPPPKVADFATLPLVAPIYESAGKRIVPHSGW